MSHSKCELLSGYIHAIWGFQLVDEFVLQLLTFLRFGPRNHCSTSGQLSCSMTSTDGFQLVCLVICALNQFFQM
jgi:hypothetical protein